ncbi:MAG: DNA polymerase III subunit gamma/tau [Prevotella sp.]|nr:DNA polymerase III subunit gamma/tau [Prevotella sp.]MCI1281210.1 DNA polymerase III subunit gamma/tau [Prevotella sp.]
MEEYIVSARKYRPMTFDTVVGQSALTTTLKNAVKSGKLAHAYLFCGPRGVGKTTCARIFAKAINCQHPTADGEACNECESCKAFNEQRSYNIFELDAASNNSVENIKTLMDQTRIPPQIGKYKVFIIDEVHMLSTAAFNAFLKTLEEPPAHVVFILATTEKHKILPTILSRCQIYDFERMTVQEITDHLKKVAQKEGISYEEEALNLIAEKADGGMRDALSIFDQATSFSQGNITYQKVIEDLNVLDSENYFKMVDMALENKVSDLMLLLNSLIAKGFDGGLLIDGLASHVRNVMMAKDAQTLPLLEVSEQQRQKFQEQAKKCPTSFIYKALEIVNRCDINYRQSSNKRLLVELTLIEVAQITQPDDASAGAGRSPRRLKSLFKNLVAPQPKVAPQVATAEKPIVRQTKASAHREAALMPTQNENDTASKPHLKLGSIGITFSDLRKGSDGTTPQKEEEVTNKDEKTVFTQDDLERQWMSMCNRMPKEMVGIASRLKNMTPKIAGYPNIEVVVDNEILLDEVERIKARITKTLAITLHNGNIHLQTRLAKPEEVKKILTKREMFDELRKDNPAIEKLRAALNLELS